MRCVTCRGVGDYPHSRSTPVPSPGPGEVLLRVERAGICAGDAKCYAGAPLFWGDASRPPYVQPPVIPGHEFAGHIAALGPGASRDGGSDNDGGGNGRWAVGDRVTAEQVVACGECLYCRKGLRWLCAPHDIFGFHTCVPGAMAEYMVLPAKALLHRVPNSLTPKEAVFIEPLSCGVHAVERGNPQPGDTVVVSGCGPIGLGMLSVARTKSPGRLVALDCSEERLALARACGADTALNVATLGADAAVAAVRALTDGGYGADVYLEASGAGASVAQGLRMVRKAATFVEFSVFAAPVSVDWSVIGDTLELDLLGAHCSGDGGYAAAVNLLAGGGIPAEAVVSHELPLDEAVAGIELVNGGGRAQASCKVALDPSLRG